VNWILMYFVSGVASVLVQSISIREFLNVFYGNELVLGAVLGIWLLWVSAGAYVGALVTSKIRRLHSVFISLVLAGASFPFIQVYLIRIARSILSVPSGQYIPFLQLVIFTMMVLFPYCFITGFTFPVGCRIYAGEEKENVAPKISRLYIAESIGFLTGGILFTFYFALHYQVYLVLGVVFVLVNAGAGILFLKGFSRTGRIIFISAGILISFYLFIVAAPLDRYTVLKRWQSLNKDIELVETIDSKYQNLALGRQLNQYSLFGNGNFLFSFPNDYEDAPLANYLLFQHPAPEDILVLGESPVGVLRYMLLHPVDSIDYVVLDSKLIEVCARFLPGPDMDALHNPKLNLFYSDARYYVKNCAKKYDLVFVNLPLPSTAMLNRYYTLEFFQEVKKILKPDGIFVCFGAHTADAITWQVGNYFSSIYNTLCRIFKDVRVSPGYTNYFFCAMKPGIATDEYRILEERYKRREVKTPYFTTAHFQYFFPPERREFIYNSVKKWHGSRVNTDLKPISYFYALLLWDAYSGSHLGPFFKKLAEGFRMKWAIIILLSFIILRIAYLYKKRRSVLEQQKFNTLFATFSCGFAAMGFETIFIFAFQNFYGYLYQMIGLLIAVFMAGLGLGGLAMVKSMKIRKIQTDMLLGVEIVIVCLAVALPFILKNLPDMRLNLSQIVFILLIFFAGFLTGVEFPVGVSLYQETAQDTGRTAGLLDWADHLGGFTGASICGTVLVPVLGIQNTCFLVAFLNLTGVIFILFQTMSPSRSSSAF